jgi:hypothetical protein
MTTVATICHVRTVDGNGAALCRPAVVLEATLGRFDGPIVARVLVPSHRVGQASIGGEDREATYPHWREGITFQTPIMDRPEPDGHRWTETRPADSWHSVGECYSASHFAPVAR